MHKRGMARIGYGVTLMNGGASYECTKQMGIG